MIISFVEEAQKITHLSLMVDSLFPGFLSLLFTLVDRIFVGCHPPTSVGGSGAAAVVLLPLFSHFRVPYKSSGPGLMLSNEKRQGHTMLVDDVSSLMPPLPVVASPASDIFRGGLRPDLL